MSETRTSTDRSEPIRGHVDDEADEPEHWDAVIWVPDLSSETGFSKYWVERGDRRQSRRIGFRRR